MLFDAIAAFPAVLAHRVLAVQGLAHVRIAHAREIHDVELESHTLARDSSIPRRRFGEAILGWLNGSIDTTLEQLIDDLTTLWLVTGEGAAQHARQRHHN